ncbi:hypothetical protein ACIGAN_34770 [Streptomyces sp. NPDC085931]|uniref:hypothetical protein n=1 Tax=Streptomyces sp. NPDC085931 TaxID=3365740 RepID=UPI0037D4DF2D
MVRLTTVTENPAAPPVSGPDENRSTPDAASAMIDLMFRHAFALAASAVADAPKAAVPVLLAAVDGARS